MRDRDGRVLYESVNLPAGAEDRDTVWRDAFQSGGPASGTAELSGETPDYVHARPVKNAGAPPMVLEAGGSFSSLEETLDTIGTAIGVALLSPSAGPTSSPVQRSGRSTPS